MNKNPSLSTAPMTDTTKIPTVTYEAHIITPMDSLIVTAAEQSPRGGFLDSAGSGFSERLSHLGTSISDMVSDITHGISIRAHDTVDKITHVAHDLTDAVSHADYAGMVDSTRCTLSRKPARNLAIAAGVGIAAGLLLKYSRRHS